MPCRPCVGWRFLVGIYVITALMGEIRSGEQSMPETALAVPWNLSHNVPALIKAATTRLTELATLYLVTEVAG
jgi:hypothetical protein